MTVSEGSSVSEPPLLDAMAVLLDGYFHEDFRAEHGGHEAAARAFVQEASAAEREAAKLALEAFLSWAEGVSRDVWQRALRRAGGSWRPRSLGPLREVFETLARDPDHS